jgi:nucleoside-diphosphate-sugar epimerase
MHMAEDASKFYARSVPIITVRLANLYGPTPLRRFDLIHLLCRQLLDEGKAQMWSTRTQRDFLYIQDAARAIVQLLDTDYTGTLNLGSGTMTPVARVREILEEVSGARIEILDVPVTGPLEFQCDMTTMHRLIDWRPRYTVEEGVRLTYETMKSYRAGN